MLFHEMLATSEDCHSSVFSRPVLGGNYLTPKSSPAFGMKIEKELRADSLPKMPVPHLHQACYPSTTMEV